MFSFKTKIISNDETVQANDTLPGEYKTDNKTYLNFRASDAWISIEILQLEGKKRMETGDLLRGMKL